MPTDKDPLPDFSDVQGGASSTAGTPANAEVEPKTYTVKPGDSLSKIAKAVYGDAAKWNLIYRANQDLIKNPDLIYPGQVLKLPTP